MRILFVHQNFPAQFIHLARALARRPGFEVVALTLGGKEIGGGVRVVRYPLGRGTSTTVHRWAADFESKVIRGEALVQRARALRAEGFTPDLIYAHPGWGEALFLRDLFPKARLVCFGEFYYRPYGLDVGFDPEFSPTDEDEACRIRVRNAHNLLFLEASDLVISPTEWQRSTYPSEFQYKFQVVHDGINTDHLRPDPNVRIQLRPDGPTVGPHDEVVTFVNRNLEPYRGFPTFMRALPELQRLRPNAQVVIIGGKGVSYGAKPKDGRSFKERLLDELGDRLDLTRVHFVGHVAYDLFVKLLQLSSAHVYLTYPFVLSWSMLEAMAVGAPLIASATPPVQEVVEEGVNGCLVDFFDAPALAERVADALANRAAWQGLRQQARATVVERYDLQRVCLPRQLQLLGVA